MALNKFIEKKKTFINNNLIEHYSKCQSVYLLDVTQTNWTVRVFGKLIKQEPNILTHDVPGFNVQNKNLKLADIN